MQHWDQILKVAARATPELRKLAAELAEQTRQEAWEEPFDDDDPWLLAALVRAKETKP